MNTDRIQCRLYNEAIGFNLVLERLSRDTLTELFLREEGLKCFDKYVEVPKDYIKWLLEENDIQDAFKTIANFTGVQTATLIKLFFFLVIKEDKLAFKTFIKHRISTKAAFIKAFKAYNTRYLANRNIKNLISPDIMICLYCYVMIYSQQRFEFEVPLEVIPYILNIEGVTPDAGAPADFDPDMPYKSDVYEVNEAPKESFLKRFHLRK